MPKMTGLGKGLDALFGPTPEEEKVKDDDVLDELKNIDVGNLTPIDALNTIYRLQNKLKNRW